MDEHRQLSRGLCADLVGQALAVAAGVGDVHIDDCQLTVISDNGSAFSIKFWHAKGCCIRARLAAKEENRLLKIVVNTSPDIPKG